MVYCVWVVDIEYGCLLFCVGYVVFGVVCRVKCSFLFVMILLWCRKVCCSGVLFRVIVFM